MSQLHPFRKTSTGLMILNTGKPIGAEADDDIESSIATITSIGEMMDRMQGKLDEQAAVIASLKKEVAELTMHKEAAYGEMTRAEAAMRTERARADRAEQASEEAIRKEREAQDKLGRLVSSVRDTFGRAERTSAA